MTPEQEAMLNAHDAKLAELGVKLSEILAWVQERRHREISEPDVPVNRGAGATSLTQSYNVSGGAGGTITGPAAFVATILLLIEGNTYEIPLVAKNP